MEQNDLLLILNFVLLGGSLYLIFIPNWDVPDPRKVLQLTLMVAATFALSLYIHIDERRKLKEKGRRQ